MDAAFFASLEELRCRADQAVEESTRLRATSRERHQSLPVSRPPALVITSRREAITAFEVVGCKSKLRIVRPLPLSRGAARPALLACPARLEAVTHNVRCCFARGRSGGPLVCV
jgi:hypothetical protein